MMKTSNVLQTHYGDPSLLIYSSTRGLHKGQVQLGSVPLWLYFAVCVMHSFDGKPLQCLLLDTTPTIGRAATNYKKPWMGVALKEEYMSVCHVLFSEHWSVGK